MSCFFLSATRATSRTTHGISVWQRMSGCRIATQAAEIPKDGDLAHIRSGAVSVPPAQFGLLSPVRGKRRTQGLQKVNELEHKVQALEEAIKVDSLAFNPLTYSEEELLVIYEDVLSLQLPEPEVAKSPSLPSTAEVDHKLVEASGQRLLGSSTLDASNYRRILARAYEIISRAERARHAVEGASASPHQNPLSLGILSIAEYEGLIRFATNAGDTKAAESVIELMRKDNIALPEDAISKILRVYSDSGNIPAADQFLRCFLAGSPTETQRHLHIMAHLKGASIDAIPTSALDLLHHYEEQNIPAPIRTYTSVITHLFSSSSSIARSQAWDIFTHMRYVAHPIPDVVLYTLMIRACASPVTTRYSSEPEKALDLWTEMTMDRKIMPTVGAYNAIILACARSGTKTYVNEAFRLARQMLDSHRDAHGFSPFRPNKRTFCALLEGAKRIGDLGRARWILAEMVKGSGGPNCVEAEIDEEVMMHIFNAYASYKVPSIRTSTGFTKKDCTDSSPIHSSASSETGLQQRDDSQSQSTSSLPAAESKDPQPSFAHIPPQSRGGVIREVKALFHRILEDRTNAPRTTTPSLPFEEKKFRNTEITTRLLNAYLSVFYKHGELSVAREMFWRLFEDVGSTRSPRSYLEALVRCANPHRKIERDLALSFSEELWLKWQQLEEEGVNNGSALNSRLVERAHVAMIRALAVNENITRAMTLLREFAAKYPPNSIRAPSPKLHFQSTRTSLVGNRPLVRMTSAADMVDDNVPPLITFRDVELLHHRLVDEGMQKDIKYVTWLCKAYEWALRVRRDEAIKAKPVNEVKALTGWTRTGRFIFNCMDSPWDEHPESTNTLQELEWTKLSSEFTNAGYREGITTGKESALQEGFDQGFATAGVPIGRELGFLRGIVSAILSSIDETCPPVLGDWQTIITEIQEINYTLSRIRFSDLVPPDVEAEEHARLHQEENGNLVGELERLEDLIEQMNTDSEGANGRLLHPAKGRPTREDVEVLKNRLEQLVARLGMNINYA